MAEQTPNLTQLPLSRRKVLGFGLAGAGIGIAALAGCSSAANSSSAAPSTAASSAAPSASSSASGAGVAGIISPATDAAAGNTALSAGTYNATFTSTTTGPGGGGGSQTLSGAYIVDGIDATIEGGTWESTKADQNVFLVVNGGTLTIKNANINKSGDSSQEDACNFYGLNSAILVVDDGSKATVTNCTVTTASNGSNALFAAGSGELAVEQVTIRSTKDSSRGLDATYAGVINAYGMDIATEGAHCGCIATDRGNGTIKVTGTNKLSATGDGSPLIYCTGDISVSNASGTANSQTMVIEGKNKVTIDNCDFTTKADPGMMIYQSMSGDAADGDATSSKASMNISNSKLTVSGDFPMIYVTNTSCEVNVTASTLNQPSGQSLIDLQEDRWGNSGSNGGTAIVTFSGCTLTGAVTAGSSSKATVALNDKTTLTGSYSGDVTITPDSTSKWSK